MYGATQKRHRRGSPFWTRWSRGPKWTRAGWVDWSSGRRRARAGDGSPDSREAEGEGDDDFYIARSGKRADLLVSQGGLWDCVSLRRVSRSFVASRVFVTFSCWGQGSIYIRITQK